MVDNNIINAIGSIIAEAEKHRNAYFFRAIQGASARRSYEKRHSHNEITWQEGKHVYTAAYSIRCTCSAIYATGTYTRDGKTTTLTAIRNSYKRLKGVI